MNKKIKTREEVNLLQSELDDDEVEKLAGFFKIFGDPTRIRILFELYNEESNVGDLAERLGMSLSAISHQLRIIKAVNLVKSKRVGKSVIYALSDDHVRRILSQGREHVAE